MQVPLITNQKARNTTFDRRFAPCVIDQEISMTTKLLASTLLAASLLAAPAIAFAQSETTSPPAKETKSMAPHKMRHAMMHHMKTHHYFRAGTTTGMSTSSSRPGGESIARKPAAD
jgi:hypothetical protein